MKITNEFAVNTPIERAWAVLTDLAGIAPCLPGAQLTGVDGDVYRGKVKVKVGPVVSEFAGTARFVEKDEARYRGVIDAKGRDARSAGNASALVTAQLRPDGGRTLVTVDTDLTISGKLAQFGSGMIKEISAKLLAQFVANLEAMLAAEEAGTTAPAGGPPASPTRAEPESAAAATTPGTSPATATAPPATVGASPGSPTAVAAPADTAAAVAAPTDTPVAVAPSPGTLTTGAPTPDTPTTGTPSPDTHAAAARSAGVGSTPAQRPPATARAEPEALDLLSIAGGSITKRLVPVLVGLVVVGAVIAWLVARG
ncbi:Carbon monoxide dehydrogenase subunit G [Micromonospora echinaurantiaca]|uniref:Carbon monoxide dehydrogenase subunit G n=1 Tax=Micromonospora echinaurantiaca TaxID=47857 RepID=A0A1C5I8J4_9ACTN|nr:SRPBCC family protein [Micromonospora echinaurantiaca]SCG54116.1 Carbon monoxide dehydrogenase subunit G [Micromonospora echinaurantiaca]